MTFEATFYRMTSYSNGEVIVRTMSHKHGLMFLILKDSNKNYKKIYDTLKTDGVYRFTVNCSGAYNILLDIHDSLTYMAIIKINSLLDLKQQELYNNLDFQLIMYDYYTGYKILYEDDNKIDEYDRNEKLKLIIDNDNLVVDKYYMVKFKKYYYDDFYYVCEYQDILVNGK